MTKLKTKSISSKGWNETVVPTLPTISLIVLKVLARTIRQKKERKGNRTGRSQSISIYRRHNPILVRP